ncbi:WD40 repeat-like protein [Meredithblackwellia eburnea MCA 4105]
MAHLPEDDTAVSNDNLLRPTLLFSASTPSKPTPRKRRSNAHSNAFFREAQLCPDGTYLLAHSEDRSLSLFNLPPTTTSGTHWIPEWSHHPPASLLSFAWFPGATSTNPPYFAFVTGTRDQPVHLLDANPSSGEGEEVRAKRRTRASYPIIDHTEKFVGPNSISFSPDGSSLYCGYENAIEIFDVNVPGVSSARRLRTTPTRSSKDGQKGIISTLSPTPASTSPGTELLAAGSFSGSVGLYDLTIGETGALVGLIPADEKGQRGGVTKVQFHPQYPHLIYIAHRSSPSIHSLQMYDLRNLGTALAEVGFGRRARGSQRLGFDLRVDMSDVVGGTGGTEVAVGDQDGFVSIYKQSSLELTGWEGNDTSSTTYPEPARKFRVSNDAVGSVSFVPTTAETVGNPTRIVTCSGSRKFEVACDSDSHSDSDEEEDIDGSKEESEIEGEGAKSLQLWSL